MKKNDRYLDLFTMEWNDLFRHSPFFVPAFSQDSYISVQTYLENWGPSGHYQYFTDRSSQTDQNWISNKVIVWFKVRSGYRGLPQIKWLFLHVQVQKIRMCLKKSIHQNCDFPSFNYKVHYIRGHPKITSDHFSNFHDPPPSPEETLFMDGP